MGRTGKSTARQGATVPTTMLYEVLVVANGGDGERFTIERDEPFSDSDTFEQGSDSYRVLAIQPGHGPLDGVIEAERLGSVGPGEFRPPS